jgi:ABC-type polysaccharide/polyol phosphate export permease
MGYLKFVSYLYLAGAAFCIYEGIMKLRSNEDSVINFVFAGILIFMFFFRQYNAKKFRERAQDKEQGN